MIPLKLTLEGIYGYRQRQVIDFERLIQARLFGIFGPIGSGKSSLPEAILLALYGNLERLNQRESRGYNLMNLRSPRMWVEFEFISGHPPERYLVTVESRRNSKRFEDVRPIERRAYRIHQGVRLPVDSEQIERAIGLSYENFRRTIIIPQGRFQEFIQLEGAEKTKMLKEIFSLQKFDLSAKTSTLLKNAEQQLENIKGRMEGLADLTAESLDAKQKEKALAEEALEKNLLHLQGLKQEEKARSLLRERHASWKKLREKLSGLEALSEVMDETRQKNELLDLAIRQFREPVMRLKELDSERSALEALCGEIEASLPLKHEALQETQDKAAEATEKLKDRAVLEQRMQAIPEILKFREAMQGVSDCTDRLGRAAAFLNEKTAEAERLGQQADMLGNQLLSLEKQMPDVQMLGKLREWWTKSDFIEQKTNDLQNRTDRHLEEFRNLQNVIRNHPTLMAWITQTGSEDMKTLAGAMRQALETIQEKKDQTEKHIETLSHRSVLAGFASGLNDQTPCPLCGSLHHPAIYNDPEARQENIGLQNLLKALRDQEKEISATLKDTETFLLQTEHMLRQEKEFEEIRQAVKNELRLHREGFSFGAHDPGNREAFEKDLQRAERISAEIKQTRDVYDKTTALLKQVREDRERALLREAELRENYISFETTARECRVRVAPGIWEALEKDPKEQLTEEVRHTSRMIQETEQVLTQLKQQADGMEKELIAMNSRLEGLRNQLNRIRTVSEETGSRLLQELQESPFGSLEEISEILAREKEIQGMRLALRDWEQEKYATLKALNELATDAEVTSFQEEAFLLLLEALKKTESERDSLSRQVALAGRQVETIQAGLELKTKLEEEKESLENRISRLLEMKRLFQANGFVNYVSTVYLKNLILIANRRFQEFTGYRLKLELNERNEFVVRDLMNNGELRHIKTLSGGQTFLASLSMAISLADIIQGHHPGSGNFFFIDEGFGSLDKTSLEAVFRALSLLSKENRIVGIISHVEDLQQEIQTFLKVELHPERGSTVTPSWV